MLYIAKRMQARPNRVQTAVESAYQLMRDNITGGNMDDGMAKKWFPFVGTLFLFIWFSNMIGYIPLPTNTHEKFDLFGAADPVVRALRGDGEHLRAARADARRVDLATTSRASGPRASIGYLKSWIPAGVEGPARVPDLRHRGHLALRPDHLAVASDCSPTSSPATC